MHVVVLIDSLGSGGAQRQAVELARRLVREHGLRVSFLVYHDYGFHAERLREAGIPVRLVARRGKADLAFPWRLRRALLALAPDVVHAFLLSPGLWGLVALAGVRGARRPLFVAAERCEMSAYSPRELAVQRFVYRRSDLVTANARNAAREIEERIGVPAERVRYLPNGIDLADWDRQAEAPCPLPLAPGRFHLALVGGFRPQKNHGLVLDALEALPPARRERLEVWFVGAEVDGAEYPRWVQAEIARRGLDGVVRTAPPTPAVPSLLRHLDALVLPSLYEGFPNVLLEAMASSLPAIATPVGDVPGMLEDGRTGLVVPLGRPDALAAALERLIDLPEAERRALGARAREVVEARYRMEEIARLHVELYREGLAGLARRGRAAPDQCT